MTKRTLYLLLALVVVSSIAAATLQGSDLQGAFKLTSTKTVASSSAILHVSSTASKESSISWGGETVTLGAWTVKADENLSINGLAYHLGVPTSIGTSDDFLTNFFSSCSVAISESGTNIETLPSSLCTNAYTNVNLTAGKTYTFTLTGVAIAEAYDTYLDEGYDGKQVSLSFLGLTQANGTQVEYTDANFLTFVEQKASTTGSTLSLTYTLEYTYGGYTLKNALWKTNSSSPSIDLTVGTGNLVQEQQNASVKTTTNTTTPGTSDAIAALLKNISVSIGDTSAITKELTIKISASGSTMEISDGTSTKTCRLVSTGTYSCDIP